MNARWGHDAAALEILNDAFDEAKRIVAETTGVPRFEKDRIEDGKQPSNPKRKP
jgi:hypothetical protein